MKCSIQYPNNDKSVSEKLVLFSLVDLYRNAISARPSNVSNKMEVIK